jgi:hypothetical protein
MSLQGDAGIFLAEAVAVLERSARIRSSTVPAAELVIAAEGVGLDARGEGTSVLVVPPDDPTLLPALNRRLVEAGIGWQYATRSSVGEGTLEGEALPEALAAARITRWYVLQAPSGAGSATRTLAEVAGDPWALEGTDAGGRRFLLVASPFSADATTLPVSTAMVRFVDWAATEWAGSGGATEYTVGSHLPAPPEATRVRYPSGREVEIDGTGTVRGTGEAGPYVFLEADTAVWVVALNPPAAESRLERLDEADIEDAIGSDVTLVDRAGDWPSETYRSRRGPELWWPLLLAVCLLLLLESMIAASRGCRSLNYPHPALVPRAGEAQPLPSPPHVVADRNLRRGAGVVLVGGRGRTGGRRLDLRRRQRRGGGVHSAAGSRGQPAQGGPGGLAPVPILVDDRILDLDGLPGARARSGLLRFRHHLAEPPAGEERRHADDRDKHQGEAEGEDDEGRRCGERERGADDEPDPAPPTEISNLKLPNSRQFRLRGRAIDVETASAACKTKTAAEP